MAMLLLSFLGAAEAMFIVSRLVLWLLKRLGDTYRRIFVAHSVAIAVAPVIASLSQPFGYNIWVFTVVMHVAGDMVWLTYDLVTFRQRVSRISN